MHEIVINCLNNMYLIVHIPYDSVELPMYHFHLSNDKDKNNLCSKIVIFKY